MLYELLRPELYRSCRLGTSRSDVLPCFARSIVNNPAAAACVKELVVTWNKVDRMHYNRSDTPIDVDWRCRQFNDVLQEVVAIFERKKAPRAPLQAATTTAATVSIPPLPVPLGELRPSLSFLLASSLPWLLAVLVDRLPQLHTLGFCVHKDMADELVQKGLCQVQQHLTGLLGQAPRISHLAIWCEAPRDKHSLHQQLNALPLLDKTRLLELYVHDFGRTRAADIVNMPLLHTLVLTGCRARPISNLTRLLDQLPALRHLHIMPDRKVMIMDKTIVMTLLGALVGSAASRHLHTLHMPATTCAMPNPLVTIPACCAPNLARGFNSLTALYLGQNCARPARLAYTTAGAGLPASLVHLAVNWTLCALEVRALLNAVAGPPNAERHLKALKTISVRAVAVDAAELVDGFAAHGVQFTQLDKDWAPARPFAAIYNLADLPR